MLDYRLSEEELAELRAAHRRTRHVHEAYRINAVILLAKGRTVADVADALLIDPDTVRGYFRRYRQGGLEQLLRMSFVSSEAWLDARQLAELDAHLQEHLHQSAESVARWVKESWGVSYTASGMTAVLHQVGYSDKKPKLVPGKADPERQEAYVETYKTLKQKQRRRRHRTVHGCHPSAAQPVAWWRMDQARRAFLHQEQHRASAPEYQWRY